VQVLLAEVVVVVVAHSLAHQLQHGVLVLLVVQELLFLKLWGKNGA
jgi:hypothetical protein